MIPIIIAATAKAVETSFWWYFLYGAGAAAGAGTGGYYGWRWWKGGEEHLRQELPIHETARQDAEIKAQIKQNIENQTRMTEISAIIVQDMTNNEAEMDSIVGKVENHQETFLVALGKMVMLAEQYETLNESITAELTKLSKIFSKEEVRQLKNVYHLIEQNSAYKVEIEQYEELVKKLMKVITVYKKEAASPHQSSSIFENVQSQFGI